MNSPIHTDTVMLPVEIEPGLHVFECPISGGHWIPLQSFLTWKTTLPQVEPSADPSITHEPVADDSANRVLICPESGRILIRYKVGHGLHFHVDRSPVTGSVWLDKGEWEALKSKKLHASLNLIFTTSYQREVRSEEYAQTFENTFRDRIGQDDFKKLVEIKDWIKNHPKSRDLCCYIIDSLHLHKQPGTSYSIFEGSDKSQSASQP